MNLAAVEKLNTYMKVREKNLHIQEIKTKAITFSKIRDLLIGMGTILEEDTENQIYVILIKAGFFNLNSAFVAVQRSKDKIILAGCAKEGLIHQHTAEKAEAKIRKKMEEENRRDEEIQGE